MSHDTGRKALADCLWGASYEQRMAAQADAIALELRALVVHAEFALADEIELSPDLVARIADLLERSADYLPHDEDPAR